MMGFTLRSEGKDVVHYVSRFGKAIKALFKPKKEEPDTTIETEVVSKDEAHNLLSFGFVYANRLAKSELEKEIVKFPVGSIIVREKKPSEFTKEPTKIIAMAKREKGFSKETGDWEFFLFNGKDMKLKTRETVGSCSRCHSGAKKTDWVFLGHLK